MDALEMRTIMSEFSSVFFKRTKADAAGGVSGLLPPLTPCQVKEQNAFARSAVSGFRKSVIFAKSLRRPITQT